jgi:hypothetical protein
MTIFQRVVRIEAYDNSMSYWNYNEPHCNNWSEHGITSWQWSRGRLPRYRDWCNCWGLGFCFSKNRAVKGKKQLPWY